MNKRCLNYKSQATLPYFFPMLLTDAWAYNKNHLSFLYAFLEPLATDNNEMDELERKLLDLEMEWSEIDVE